MMTFKKTIVQFVFSPNGASFIQPGASAPGFTRRKDAVDPGVRLWYTALRAEEADPEGWQSGRLRRT